MQNEVESSAHFQTEVEIIKQGGTTIMKKFMSITLLTMLVLALCLPIIARYEVCAYCQNGRLVEEIEKERVYCSECGKTVTKTTTYMRCNSCGHAETWDVTLSCGH